MFNAKADKYNLFCAIKFKKKMCQEVFNKFITKKLLKQRPHRITFPAQ